MLKFTQVKGDFRIKIVFEVLQFIQELDSRQSLITDYIEDLKETIVQEGVINFQSNKALDVKIDTLADGIGVKPTNIDRRFDAPSVWAALLSLADFTQKHLGTHQTSVAMLSKSLEASLNTVHAESCSNLLRSKKILESKYESLSKNMNR